MCVNILLLLLLSVGLSAARIVSESYPPRRKHLWIALSVMMCAWLTGA